MSASISYRVIEKSKPFPTIKTWTPSSFMEKVEKVFGSFPAILGENDIPKLETLLALDKSKDPNEWKQLIEIIQEVGKIEVFAEY